MVLVIKINKRIILNVDSNFFLMVACEDFHLTDSNKAIMFFFFFFFFFFLLNIVLHKRKIQ